MEQPCARTDDVTRTDVIHDDVIHDSDPGFESFGSASPSASSDLADDLRALDIRGSNAAINRKEPCSSYRKSWSSTIKSQNPSLKTSSRQTKQNRTRRLTVLFDYTARHSDDVTVRHQDVVILLDDSDEYWSLVETAENTTGYVPKSHVIDLTIFNLDPGAKTTYL